MRKVSVQEHLSQACRTLSTIIAPQIAKIGYVHCLQNYLNLEIKIGDIVTYIRTIEQFTLHNNLSPETIKFNIVDDKKNVVLFALLEANELVLYESTNKPIANISFPEKKAGIEGCLEAKICNPHYKVKIFQVETSDERHFWKIFSTADKELKCKFEVKYSHWREILKMCGFLFEAKWWELKTDKKIKATIFPCITILKENTIRVSWHHTTDNETRLLVLCFALIQTVNEAFPILSSIVNESRRRKSIIGY
uniref:Arp2/3 complex 34 kDa subunit n=1 Tax=Strongyloides stercoralis TaxID=6248 RepID=A0A0K0EMB2_STRER